MHIAYIQEIFARLRRQDEGVQDSLPYSALPTDPTDPTSNSMNADGACDDPSFDDCETDQRREASLGRLSSLLSNFTLGFADGLTVPFALTAGLSSLGETRTVIYAGAAEICAGCISMGIGGYLAAKGETATKAVGHGNGDELEAVEQDSVQEYLAPLDLPPELLQSVKAHVDGHPVILQRLRSSVDSTRGSFTEKPKDFSPAVLGLSVSFGYMVGGLLPLFPYFFVSRVDDGLKWSFAVCILALFVFGFSKEYLLNRAASPEDGWQDGEAGREVARWERVKQGLWEGMRMVIMGGIAAIAAVFCVKLFDDVLS
ncbi:VIT family-domain-containing protein [Hypoxylon sp. FL0543]|nr:VIT family-domain-containing protein [Hypoxylon sp. FL0543]